MPLFDILVSLLGLIVLTPFFLIIALFIRLDTPGPIFFRPQRVGQNGRLFHLYKFRTMTVAAAGQGPGITAQGDTRITRAGRYLRKTKIDELPQLINVLKGDMRLVGPRPEDPQYVALYTADQRRLLALKPGITSAASLAYRHEQQLLSGPDWENQYCREIMPAKIAIDLDYQSGRAFTSDLILIANTILSMFKTTSATQKPTEQIVGNSNVDPGLGPD